MLFLCTLTSYALFNQNWCIFHNLGYETLFRTSLWHTNFYRMQIFGTTFIICSINITCPKIQILQNKIYKKKCWKMILAQAKHFTSQVSNSMREVYITDVHVCVTLNSRTVPVAFALRWVSHEVFNISLVLTLNCIRYPALPLVHKGVPWNPPWENHFPTGIFSQPYFRKKI